MFGNQTTPVSVLRFDAQEFEGPTDVPICRLPLVQGEAMWRTARENAVPYVHYVDALIRDTLPRVFPGMDRGKGGSDGPETPSEDPEKMVSGGADPNPAP